MEILSDEEQRAKWDWELENGLIDAADILMQRDPDRYPDRETAQEHLNERQAQPVQQEEQQGSLLEALTRPVE